MSDAGRKPAASRLSDHRGSPDNRFELHCLQAGSAEQDAADFRQRQYGARVERFD
jgi:hypothetical protein